MAAVHASRSSEAVGGRPLSTAALTCAVVSDPDHERFAFSSFSMLPRGRSHVAAAVGSARGGRRARSVPRESSALPHRGSASARRRAELAARISQLA